MARRTRGFTLIEILIVVGIIGVLMSIAIPGFLRARRESRARAIQSELITIDSVTRTYVLEEGVGTDAGMPTLETLVTMQYLRTEPKPPIPGVYISSPTLEGFPKIVPESGNVDPEWYHPLDPDKP